MLSWACAFSCLPTAGVNFGGVGGREDTFRKLNFVAGGSRKLVMRLRIALTRSARVRVGVRVRGRASARVNMRVRVRMAVSVRVEAE